MKITPLDKYAEPRFPTRAILDEHPELLRLVPKRWQRNPVVLSALAGLCLLILSTKDLGATPSKSASKVAPIFQHGDGRGAPGCLAVNPPVFLSEADARQIIMEEGKLAGISFVSDSQTLHSISIPVTDSSFSLPIGKEPKKLRTRPLDIKLDGNDKKLNISYEYISRDDFHTWEKKEGIQSSILKYDILKVAQSLREGLVKAKPSGTYAIFYDPLFKLGQVVGGSSLTANSTNDEYIADIQRREKEAKSLTRQELRKQVKDFIVWMKAQGVI